MVDHLHIIFITIIYLIALILYIYLFWGKFSTYSSTCHRTPNTDWYGLELTEFCCLCLWRAGIKGVPYMSSSNHSFNSWTLSLSIHGFLSDSWKIPKWSHVWWLTLVTPTLQRLKQKNWEFKSAVEHVPGQPSGSQREVWLCWSKRGLAGGSVSHWRQALRFHICSRYHAVSQSISWCLWVKM